MSLTDVGLNFKLTGVDSFASKMDEMKSGFEKLSSAIDGDKIKGSLNKFEGHFSAMHRGIKSHLHLTEVAIAGFMTGKAIKGLSHWILGGTGAEVDQFKDYLRIHGATTEGIQNMAKSMDDLAAKRPLDKISGWNAGENIMSMLGGLDDQKLTDRLIKANSNLSYLLDAQGNMNKAVDLSTSFIAGFGAKLDPAGKVDLYEKFNRYIKYLTDHTQLRGPDIQTILPQVIGPYVGAGKDPAKMFAHMGLLDFLRGQSGEVLKNLFGKEGKSFGAVGAELDKQSYLADLQTNPLFRAKEAQRAWNLHRERLKSVIRSEGDLPKGMQHELSQAVRNRQKDYEALGGRLLAQGKDQEYSSLMLGALTRLKQLQGITGKSVNSIIAEHFGETAIKGIFPFLEQVASGKDRRIEAAMKAEAARGDMTGEINSKFQSLGSKGKTFEQMAGALANDFRRIFEPATIEVLDGWQKSITAVRTKMAEMKQESQISQNIKDVLGSARGGFLDTLYGKDRVGSSQSLDDAITSFAQSLSQPGWKDAGAKLGTAVGEFVMVMGQLKQIIGMAFKILSPLMSKESAVPLATAAAASKLMPNNSPWYLKAWAGFMGYMGANAVMNGPRLPSSPKLDERGLVYPTPLLSGDKSGSALLQPVHRSATAGGDLLQPAHSSGGSGGGSIQIIQQHENVVNLDGEVIFRKLEDRIDNYIERKQSDQNRARGNAQDRGLF